MPSVTGGYKFRGYGDDAFAVYLNKNMYGSKISFVNATPIAFSNNHHPYNFYPNYYTKDYPSAES